jgi:cytochrome c-type biogenesis protein CcmH/NrfF
MNRRVIAWLAIAVVGVSTLVFAAVDDGAPTTNADRAYGLAKDFACPVCQGQSVAESDVVVARNIRREIRVWVDEGRSDDFIREQLVADFGEDIDYTPSSDGITALVWILPVVAGSVAVGGLALVFRRWRLEGELEASADDAALVAAARSERS